MDINYERLWEIVTAQRELRDFSIHGPDHWRRVERNALFLAKRTGADVEVVRLFALFHDSRRVDDGHDEGHGARGADYAKTLAGTEFELSSPQANMLCYACTWHTDGVHHDDPTIGTCWDADRLDLTRIGAVPDPAYMSTEIGREIATYRSIEEYVKHAK